MNGTTKRPRDVSDDEEDDKPFLAPKSQRRLVVPGEQCPFLDTISRQAGHHLFINTDNGRVFCIPENYEVVDRSLKDIQHVLNPLYDAEDLKGLAKLQWARTIDGSDYMPGLVGLNNMKRNDYVNVVVQCLVRVPKLRDFFILPERYKDCDSELVRRFGELVRKVWNARAFKGPLLLPPVCANRQVSPHEFLQEVINASSRRFTADTEADPVQFWMWLLNALHLGLTGGKRKKSSIITKCFQGQLQVTTLAGTGAAAGREDDLVETTPFFLLSLDLPPARLFQDAMQEQIIPQVPLMELLEKYNGERVMDDVATGRRRFRVKSLPQYLAMSVNRFTKNRFFVEKNPTIVNFPCRNLDMHPHLHDTMAGEDGAEKVGAGDATADADMKDGVTGAGGGAASKPGHKGKGGMKQKGKKRNTTENGDGKTHKTPEEAEQARRQHKLKQKQMGLYNLLASVSHVGPKRPEGIYKAYVHRAGDMTWYEVQDLMIGETVQEAVVISEAYLQVYERAA